MPLTPEELAKVPVYTFRPLKTPEGLEAYSAECLDVVQKPSTPSPDGDAFLAKLKERPVSALLHDREEFYATYIKWKDRKKDRGQLETADSTWDAKVC